MTTRRVLIVEGDADLCEMFRQVLKRDGFDPIGTGDVRSAVRIVETDPPDAVLLDLGLPREDGYVLLEALKRDPRTASIPVIVITGYSPFVHREKCIAAGAAAFFQKPVDRVKLRDAIGETLGTG